MLCDNFQIQDIEYKIPNTEYLALIPDGRPTSLKIQLNIFGIVATINHTLDATTEF